jgi:hypothetical protein
MGLKMQDGVVSAEVEGGVGHGSLCRGRMGEDESGGRREGEATSGGRYKMLRRQSLGPWTRRREADLPNSKSNLPNTVISGFPGGAVGQRDPIPKHPHTGENMEHVCETRCFGRVCRRPTGPHCGRSKWPSRPLPCRHPRSPGSAKQVSTARFPLSRQHGLSVRRVRCRCRLVPFSGQERLEAGV